MSNRLIIKNGTLIDGSGKAQVANGAIIVEGNTIKHVGSAQAVGEKRPGDTVIDAAGKTIMPGMIDGHVHISSHQGALPSVRFTSTPEFATLWAARIVGRVLRSGVTGISVPGGKFYADVTVREAVDGGLLEGPRIFCAGRALTPLGGIFDGAEPTDDEGPEDSVGVICNSLEDFVRETRRQCKRGVNMIKIADSYWGDTQTVTQEELTAVVGEAHRRNTKVTIHSRGSGTTRASALAGVDWIYHADYATDEDLDAVAEAGIPIMPVFTQCNLIAEQGEEMGFSRPMRDKIKKQLDVNFRAIQKARERGIPILVGTDSGNAAAFTHGAYHGLEPGILVKEIGLSPMEAIVATTSLNAQVIGLAGRVGTIAPGMLADIIVWNQDPLADIGVLARPELLSAIVKDGRVIDRNAEGFRRLETEPRRARIMLQG